MACGTATSATPTPIPPTRTAGRDRASNSGVVIGFRRRKTPGMHVRHRARPLAQRFLTTGCGTGPCCRPCRQRRITYAMEPADLPEERFEVEHQVRAGA